MSLIDASKTVSDLRIAKSQSGLYGLGHPHSTAPWKPAISKRSANEKRRLPDRRSYNVLSVTLATPLARFCEKKVRRARILLRATTLLIFFGKKFADGRVAIAHRGAGGVRKDGRGPRQLGRGKSCALTLSRALHRRHLSLDSFRVGWTAAAGLGQTRTFRTATETAYSITWSAKARTLGEICRPRA
jgi:hypothetical protein